MKSQTSGEDHQEEESEDDHDLYQSFRDSDQSISQSINQSINRSPGQRSSSNSLEQNFTSHFNVYKIGEGELTQRLYRMTITGDQLTSAASIETVQRIKPETQKESRPELRIKERTSLSTTTGSLGTGSRITKIIEKYDPSPGTGHVQEYPRHS